jgi:hypothetical protein
MPKLVNIRKKELQKKGYHNFNEWKNNPKNVYIGRNLSYYVYGTFHSKWHNPYSIKKYGLENCLKLYEDYLRSSPELLASLPELKGKRLGCWCTPEKCHGDILIKLYYEQKNNLVE